MGGGILPFTVGDAHRPNDRAPNRPDFARLRTELSDLIQNPPGYDELLGRSALAAADGDWLRLAGVDRARFANGLVSCDLKSLSAGSGAYGFFTNPKGQVLADAVFFETGDELWVELPRGHGAAIAKHIRTYVVADRVEIGELADWSAVRVAGPSAGRRLVETLGVGKPATGWNGVAEEVLGARLLVRGELRLGVPATIVAGPRAAVAAAGDALAAAGVAPAEGAAVSAVRIEASFPWFATDFHEGFFPQETGLEHLAVSYEKGCYLGQEVVARIHFRGKVNRVLRGLLFDAGARPRSGADLALDGEVVGTTGGTAYSPRLKRPIGLAIAHRKAAPGAELESAGNSCRLVELPFDLDGPG